MVYPFNTRLSQKTKQNDSNLPLVFLEFEFSHSLGRLLPKKALKITPVEYTLTGSKQT
jgi:hypothetical protein